MNLLLDTCAAIHLSQGTLPAVALRRLRSADRIHVSLVTPWEIALKAASGKNLLPMPVELWFEKFCARYSLAREDLALSRLTKACSLPSIHRDPFDRILIATALELGTPIITSDRIIPEYPGILTFWDRK